MPVKAVLVGGEKYFVRSHLGSPGSLLTTARQGGEGETPVHHGTAGLREINVSSAPGQREGSVLWDRFTRKLSVPREQQIRHTVVHKAQST